MKATYTYLADGTKIKTINASGVGYDYIGSFKYNRSNSNITLESVATAGGRTYKTSSGYEARYFVTDHLGSTRLVTNSSGTVLEQSDYMPYGDRHANSALAASTNPYLYNGKESQKDFGINDIDSEARFQRLDGAFNSIDPLCEKYYHISPYAYCAANPINLIDPNGTTIWIHFFNENGDLQKLKYLANMEYNGINEFVTNIINNLNAIYNNGGDLAMNTLIESKYAFNFVDQLPQKGTASFNADKNGGGNINAGNISNLDFGSVETIAHELFHGVQHENGQGGPSIFNEIEAYVFGNAIANNWGVNNTIDGSMSALGRETVSGKAYEEAFSQLSTIGYSKKYMQQAILNFKKGAFVNNNGTYNNFRSLPARTDGKPIKSLLSGYYKP